MFLNALTIDVEDYFQVSGFERDIDRAAWGSFQSRVVGNTRRITSLLQAHGVSATFFVLGWVAERFPELIRELDAAGHEIGSHGYWHRLIYEQSPDEFRADLRRSQVAIEQAIGRPAVVYRAPSFSITDRSLWALPILAEEGFTIDSSIFPIHHDRYGIPRADRGPHLIRTEAGSMTEFPASVAVAGPLKLPICGGGYFRLAPYLATATLLDRINQVNRRPFVFYLHPWEIDPEQPRLSAGSRTSRLRHYVNLASTAAKLDRLMKRFAFGTISEALNRHSATAELPSYEVGNWASCNECEHRSPDAVKTRTSLPRECSL